MDTDGDSMTNLMERMLGTDPRAAESAHGARVQVEEISEENYLTITFSRLKGIDAADYAPRVSSNLMDWDDGPENVQEIDFVDEGAFEKVTVRDRTPMSVSDRRFIQLQLLGP